MRFNRFANERKQGEEKEYRRRQRENKRQQTQDWVDEGEAAEARGENVEVEEEVAVEPVVRPKNPAMFKGLPSDGFKAPRLPRHRALTGRNSPPRPPPRQVPSFHQGGKSSKPKSFIRLQNLFSDQKSFIRFKNLFSDQKSFIRFQNSFSDQKSFIRFQNSFTDQKSFRRCQNSFSDQKSFIRCQTH